MLALMALLVLVVKVAVWATVLAVGEMILVVVVTEVNVSVAVAKLVDIVVWLGGAVTVKVVEAESPPGPPLALIA